MHCSARKSGFERNVEKEVSFSHAFGKEWFSTGKFSFSTINRGKLYRLELMLVLISFTISAKEASVFIFFSTCWME